MRFDCSNRQDKASQYSVNVQTAVLFEIAGQTRQALGYQPYAFAPTLAPQWKPPITGLYPSGLAWKPGYASEAYRAEKQKILDDTITYGYNRRGSGYPEYLQGRQQEV